MILEDIKKADLANVAIFSGAGVDPDGLAAQSGIRVLIKHLGGESISFYKGSFNRAQNKTMNQLLSLNPKPENEFIESNFTCVISVDGPAEICPVIPHFVIDHHKAGEPAKEASDIQEVGACSSIVWKYLKAIDYDFTADEGPKVATALAIGIITDTDNFKKTNCSSLDFEAFVDCSINRDAKLFAEIMNYKEKEYCMDTLCDGWKKKETRGNMLVTNLGTLTKDQSGVISDAAAKFNRYYGTTLVFGLVDGSLMASVRSTDWSVEVGDFVRQIFGTGGGKLGAGAVTVKLPICQDLPTDLADEVCDSLYKAVAHKALKAAGDGVDPRSTKSFTTNGL